MASTKAARSVTRRHYRALIIGHTYTQAFRLSHLKSNANGGERLKGQSESRADNLLALQNRLLNQLLLIFNGLV